MICYEMPRHSPSWPVVFILSFVLHGTVKASIRDGLIDRAIGLSSSGLRRNLSFESTEYGALQVDTPFQFTTYLSNADISASNVGTIGMEEPCSTDKIAVSGVDPRLVKKQVRA
jgi:hypothetical protein